MEKRKFGKRVLENVVTPYLIIAIGRTVSITRAKTEASRQLMLDDYLDGGFLLAEETVLYIIYYL